MADPTAPAVRTRTGSGTHTGVTWFKWADRPTWHVHRTDTTKSRCSQIAFRPDNDQVTTQQGGWPSPVCNNCVRTLDVSHLRTTPDD